MFKFNISWPVVQSFAARSVVSGVLAGLAYAVGHVVDLGLAADNAALVTFIGSYVVHLVHVIAGKWGVDPDPEV